MVPPLGKDSRPGKVHEAAGMARGAKIRGEQDRTGQEWGSRG